MKESVRIIMAPDFRERESFISNPEVCGFDNEEEKEEDTFTEEHRRDKFVPFCKISIFNERQIFIGQLTFVLPSD